MGMGQGRIVVLADGKILKPPNPSQHGQLMIDFHIFIAAVQPVFQMGFRQIAFKRSYLKIFQQRFRMQVRLVGKLGITENSRTYIGIISRRVSLSIRKFCNRLTFASNSGMDMECVRDATNPP